MCFFLSTRSGSFSVAYVNETIYLETAGSSLISAEILLEAKDEIKSIDIIYPNTDVKITDFLNTLRGEKGYNDLDDSYTVSLYHPEREDILGKLHQYQVGELFKESEGHTHVLDIIKFSIFTIVFNNPLAPGQKTWIKLLFKSPNASHTKTLLLEKKYISAPISGPLNTKRAFEQRIEEGIQRISNPLEYSNKPPIYKEKVELVFKDLKNTIVGSFVDDADVDVKKWYLSIIPQPSISKFSATIKQGHSHLTEIEPATRPRTQWPILGPVHKVPIISGILKSIKFHRKTLLHEFYFHKNSDEKKPKFMLDCNGVYEMPYIKIMATFGFLYILFAIISSFMVYLGSV